MSDPNTPPAGCYDDGSGRQRWWDGQQWGPFAEQAAEAQPANTPPGATDATPVDGNAPKAKQPWLKNKFVWIGAGAVVLIAIIAVNAINENRQLEQSPAPTPEATAVHSTVTVPDLVGQDGATARDALTELGFTVEFDAGDESVWSPGNWTVDTQSPAAGSEAAEGDTVTLTVSKPTEPDDAAPDSNDAERSAQLEQAIKNGLGVQDSFTELYASDPSLWGGYISGVRVEGSLAYITLQIASDESHRDEYGQQAAKALSTLLTAEDVEGIDWLIVEDASQVVIDQAQPNPIM